MDKDTELMNKWEITVRWLWNLCSGRYIFIFIPIRFNPCFKKENIVVIYDKYLFINLHRKK